ncbi:uncharacterized protein LOC112563578 isoform X2 [Pomacea canaliculata]|uniref:uncharacterized protein LOC112563578 isoform X2 n=1 Tax=Pomacea canaliculata TaxID=400727 RepID=UPI000D73756D|nr:uncharacterized protein LOC112563578 isoform X2 [Pomacea canaliculata]
MDVESSFNIDIESSFFINEDSGSDMEIMDVQYSPKSFESTAQVGVLISGDCRLVALDLLGNISVNFHEMYCKSPLLKGMDFEQLSTNMKLHFTLLPEELQCFISLFIIPDESLLTTTHWIPISTLNERCSDYLLQTKEFHGVNTSSASDIFLKIGKGEYTVSFPSKEEMECDLKQLFSMERCGDYDLKNLTALLVDTENCNSISGQKSEQNLLSVLTETGTMIENKNCVSHSEKTPTKNDETVDDNRIILPACEDDPKKRTLSRSNTVKQSNFSKGFLFKSAMLPKIPCYEFADFSLEFDDLLASFNSYEAFNIRNDGLCQELPNEPNIPQHSEEQDVTSVVPLTRNNISTQADNEGNAVHGDRSEKRQAADALTDSKPAQGRKKKTAHLTSSSELSNSSVSVQARSTEDKNLDDLVASGDLKGKMLAEIGLFRQNLSRSSQSTNSSKRNEKDITSSADSKGNAVHVDHSVSVVDVNYGHKKRRAADALTDSKHEKGRKKKAARLTSSELSSSYVSLQARSTEDKSIQDDRVASGDLKEEMLAEIGLFRKNLSGSFQSTNSSKLNKKDLKSSADCFISLMQKKLPEASCDTYQSHKPTSKNRNTLATDQSEYSHMPKKEIAQSRETIHEESSKVYVSKQDHKDALKEHSYKKTALRHTKITSGKPVKNTLVTKELSSKESDQKIQNRTILKRISPNSWKVVTPNSKKDNVGHAF